MTRTYGTISWARTSPRSPAGEWIVDAEPHVMMRLRRIFKRGSAVGKLHLKPTDEVARDLTWALERWPMECEAIDRLQAQADAYERRVAECYGMITGEIAPRPFDLAIPARDYQRIAADLWLRARGLLLADDVGLGKTASAICGLTDPETRPALVVTLTHLPLQWQRELARFAPGLRAHIVKSGQPYDVTRSMTGKKARKAEEAGQVDLFEARFPDVLIINYHKLAGWADTLAGVVKAVVFDEVQELRKGDTAKAHAAKHIADAAVYRLGLSATPIYNYGGEFWQVFQVLRPESLGSRIEFITEWCTGGSEDVDKTKVKDPRAFGSYLRDSALMLRRTRHDVARELPACTKIVQYVDTDEKALDEVADAAAALARVLLSQESGWQAKGEAARDLDWRLRQATGIAKAVHVADFVRLLVESGERVVLYGWHREVYGLWLERLKDLGPVMFTGSESVPQKEAARLAFIEGRSPILIMSLRAGAGLDGLQAVCRTVVYGELDWSPGVHEQGTGRVHRDGQPEPVMVYYLMADGGSDPVVAEVLGLKKQQIEGVRDPNRTEVAETAEGRENGIKRMAQVFLEKRGRGAAVTT